MWRSEVSRPPVLNPVPVPQTHPHLQGLPGLSERRLRSGGGPREGPQRLPAPSQHRDVPDQAAGGVPPHAARGHHEGVGVLGRTPRQHRHLQRGLVEPRASLRQHRGQAERKCAPSLPRRSERCLAIVGSLSAREWICVASPGLRPLGFALWSTSLVSVLSCSVGENEREYPGREPWTLWHCWRHLWRSCCLSLCLIRACESRSWPCGFVSSWRLKDNNIYGVFLSLLSRVS